MSDDARAIDLSAPRLCPYCRERQCLPGVTNCMPCMRNAYVQVWREEWVRKVNRSIYRPSWWARLRRWFLEP